MSAETPESAPLRTTATQQGEAARQAFERMDFSAAAEAVLAISGRGNLYMEEQAPWGTLKKVCVCNHLLQSLSWLKLVIDSVPGTPSLPRESLRVRDVPSQMLPLM